MDKIIFNNYDIKYRFFCPECGDESHLNIYDILEVGDPMCCEDVVMEMDPNCCLIREETKLGDES